METPKTLKQAILNGIKEATMLKMPANVMPDEEIKVEASRLIELQLETIQEHVLAFLRGRGVKQFVILIAMILSSCATTQMTYEWHHSPQKSVAEMQTDSDKCERDSYLTHDQYSYFMACMRAQGHSIEWKKQ